MKKFTVAVLGMGKRGIVYTREMLKRKDKYNVVCCCEIDPVRINDAKLDFGFTSDNIYTSETEFFKEKRADLLVIATQDQDHVRHACKALELGYNILMEKPISNLESECYKLLKAQKKYNKKVFICHVLRYAPAFRKLKELLDENIIGDLVMIDDIEQVYYFHQAHSFVRGNWRRKDLTSPMIIQKCCHDLDLLQWYANSKCKSVSSFGSLKHFTKENKPIEAADRCTDCKLNKSCCYSAVKGYIDDKFWGTDLITGVRPITDEAVYEGLKNSPYGRCVYSCDNDVVDHQTVNIQFENGVVANLKMIAFTKEGGRIIKFYGTKGEINFDGHNEFIDIKIFGGENTRIKCDELVESGYDHGGGDAGIIDGFYDLLIGKTNGGTTLEASIESHLIGYAAETSRLNNGKTIKIKR